MDLVELLLDTSSSDEDEEGEMLVEAVQLMARRRLQRICNFETEVVASWDDKQVGTLCSTSYYKTNNSLKFQFKKVFRMSRNSMHFISLELLRSTSFPSDHQPTAEKYVLAFLW
jgi:hypothetical protein